MSVYKMKMLILLLVIIYSVVLLEFSNFLTPYPLSDDSYYHGAAALSIPLVQRINKSLYSYYSYPIPFIFGGLLCEFLHLDGLIFFKIYYIFVSVYIALIGFLIGKRLFEDFSSAVICSILTISSAYYFPRWFSPFSLSSIFTMTALYCFLVLCVKRGFGWSSATILFIVAYVLSHLGNATFFSLYLLGILPLILLKRSSSIKNSIFRNTAYFWIPTTVINFSFFLFLFWNLFINDFQTARFIKDLINTIVKPPVEDVVQLFTEVYFKKNDLLSVLRRIYILSIPSIGSLSAFYWGLYGCKRSGVKFGMFLLLFVMQFFFIMLNVADYLVRFGFTEGLGIVTRTRWLLYLVSSWWITNLIVDLKRYFLEFMEKRLSIILLRKTLLTILIVILLIPGTLLFYVNFVDSAPKVVNDRDIQFNIYLAHFISANPNLYGYTTQNNILYYYLTSFHGIREGGLIAGHLISMYEATYSYKDGSLSNILRQMNVLIAVNKSRALSIYPGFEGMVDMVFSQFNIEKSAVIFDNKDHKIFLKEDG